MAGRDAPVRARLSVRATKPGRWRRPRAATSRRESRGCGRNSARAGKDCVRTRPWWNRPCRCARRTGCSSRSDGARSSTC
jgi:hypothetical protein